VAPLHLFLVWAHLLAAISWIGGMMFLSLALAPAYRSGGQASEAAGLFRLTARRFRAVAWTAIAVLLLTGPLLVIDKGWPLFEPTRWSSILVTKVCLVALLLVTVALHDFVLGARTRSFLATPPNKQTGVDRLMLRSASWLPRLAIVIASGVVLAAVILARS
jgi:uncharacterized membrane protein